MTSTAAESDPFIEEAINLVDKAVEQRGAVFTRHPTSKHRTFEDRLCEQIFDDYISRAMRVVDDGRWEEAHETARAEVIGQTALTLRYQA